MTPDDRPHDPSPTDVPPRSAAIVVVDVADSTGFSVRFGDLEARRLVQRFFTRVEAWVATYRGHTVKRLGDDRAMLIFPEADAAFAFATGLQRSLAAEPILAGDDPVKVRISVHTGSIRLSDTSYGQDAFGAAVELAARLNSLAEPGEIVVSATAAGDLSEAGRRALGAPERVTLKGNRTVDVNRVDVTRSS